MNRLPSADDPDRPEPVEFPGAAETKAQMAHYLLQGNEQEAAAWVLAMPADVSWHTDRYSLQAERVSITWRGNRDVYDLFSSSSGPGPSHPQWALYYAVHRAGRAIANAHGAPFAHMGARLDVPRFTTEDQNALIDLALGRRIHNQAPGMPTVTAQMWNHLRFRSKTEVKIAEALERAGAAFWPNCRARVGGASHRRNIEADFLVLSKGRFGVLEIDGEPWHPAERRAEEQVRDRLWHRHGLRLVQHYDSKPCYERPDDVVADFLRLLEQD